jgi:hypothetical protein
LSSPGKTPVASRNSVAISATAFPAESYGYSGAIRETVYPPAGGSGAIPCDGDTYKRIIYRCLIAIAVRIFPFPLTVSHRKSRPDGRQATIGIVVVYKCRFSESEVSICHRTILQFRSLNTDFGSGQRSLFFPPGLHCLSRSSDLKNRWIISPSR